MKRIFLLFIIIIVALGMSGCLNDDNYIDVKYAFTLSSNGNLYEVIIPTVIDFNNESVLQNDDIIVEKIYELNIDNTQYGKGIKIISSEDISFEKTFNIQLSEKDNFIQSRYFLSLATDYYEDLRDSYKNQGSQFYLFKNSTTNITFSMSLKTDYHGDSDDSYAELINIEVDLKNGWNIYNGTREDSGD